MAVKVTKRTTNDGVRYSISGLTFAQAFRVKNAMYDCEEKMKEISEMWRKVGNLANARKFRDFAKDAHEVFNAFSGILI